MLLIVALCVVCPLSSPFAQENAPPQITEPPTDTAPPAGGAPTGVVDVKESASADPTKEQAEPEEEAPNADIEGKTFEGKAAEVISAGQGTTDSKGIETEDPDPSPAWLAWLCGGWGHYTRW